MRNRATDAVFVLALGLALVAGSFFWSRASTSVIPISLASGQEVVFVGDGWFADVASDERNTTSSVPEMLSDEFGWTPQIRAAIDTGYVSGRITFAEQLQQLPASVTVSLVIVQGALSDASVNRSSYTTAVASTWRATQEKFPNAALVVIGPAASTLPATPELADTDLKLARAAESAGIEYISPLKDNWVSQDERTKLFANADTNTLTPAGAVQIAQEVQKALHTRVN